MYYHPPAVGRLMLVLLAWPLAGGGCASFGAAAGTPRHYVCPSTTEAVEIDGVLDEAAWDRTRWSDAFVDIEGDDRPRPRYVTRFKMLWDEQYLYVGAVMEEPHVWGTLGEHDDTVFYDNDFEVFLDPDGDTLEYFEIEVNALNTIFDLFLVRPYREGGPALHDWDLKGIRTAVHVDGTLNDPSDIDATWSVELALPWRGFVRRGKARRRPEAGDVWRINFSRVQWQHEIVEGRYRKRPETREDNWVWSPQGAVNMHIPERWGYVTFSAGSP